MPLSNRDLKVLKRGTVYEVDHERKGRFIGQFLGFDDEPERLGDKVDKVFLTFKYDVRAGTDQAHMQVGVKDEAGYMKPVRVSNLRPSLIRSIRQTEEQQWLLEVVVPEGEKAGPSLRERFLGRR